MYTYTLEILCNNGKTINIPFTSYRLITELTQSDFADLMTTSICEHFNIKIKYYYPKKSKNSANIISIKKIESDILTFEIPTFDKITTDNISPSSVLLSGWTPNSIAEVLLTWIISNNNYIIEDSQFTVSTHYAKLNPSLIHISQNTPYLKIFRSILENQNPK